MNEFYCQLGVAPSATEDEIKRAYRKLAKQFHPDLHPNDAQAEARFKEINEAYEVLSDPEKRRKYDQAQRPATQQAAERQAQKKSRTPKGGPLDFSQMQGGFARFFGFDPQSGQVTDESKLSGKGQKNPLDMSDLFEHFMGFK